MIRATLSQIAAVLHALSPAQDIEFHGVSTDSRQVSPRALYIPLRGEHFDGHDFVRAALDNGASSFLWDQSLPVPTEVSHVPHVLVTDTLQALQSIAMFYRRELGVKVVAITGSNGKTSTKDLVAQVLSVQFNTYKTEGNLNNHIGLPLSILRMPENTEIAVLEMGMNALLEIARLCEIAQPDVGVITNIGEAHIGMLGSRENIARAKWELIESLQPGALAILPDDEPLIQDLTVPPGVAVWYVGESPEAQLQISHYHPVDGGCSFMILPDQFTVNLPIHGKHQARNALCAFACAKFFAIDGTSVASALGKSSLTHMRMEVVELSDTLTLINDAYNAAPSSTYAALTVLQELPCDYRIAVLGDMMELGQESERLHAKVGVAVMHSGTNALLAVGDYAHNMVQEVHESASFQVATAANITDAWPILQSLIQSNQSIGKTVILLKASRKMQFEQLVILLKDTFMH